MRYNLLTAVCVAISFSACSEPDPPKPTTVPATPAYTAADSSLPDISAIAAGYAAFQSMTPKPVAVSYQTWGICANTSAYDRKVTQQAIAAHSPFISIFMNDAAADAFSAKKPYPIGSVVIKQKEPTGVGGMVKRPPGYNPDHGDWEYFYFEDPQRVSSGKLSTCVNCHAAAAHTDHVFGSWVAGSHR